MEIQLYLTKAPYKKKNKKANQRVKLLKKSILLVVNFIVIVTQVKMKKNKVI